MSAELEDFVADLQFWHTNRVAHLRAIQEATKKGTTLKVGDEDDTRIVMTGRDAAMFKCGLEAALVELGTLPFTVSKLDDEDDEDDES